MGRGLERVSFDDESFGDISEVGYHFRDVTLGNAAFCGGVQDYSEVYNMVNFLW